MENARLTWVKRAFFSIKAGPGTAKVISYFLRNFCKAAICAAMTANSL